MSEYLILTVIGDDRPGLVGALSSVISAHQGNWLESSMSHLSGKFAGIVRVEIAADRVIGLKAALASLSGLKVAAESSAQAPPVQGHRLKLALVGQDRIGIVKEVSQVLARHAVNVEELATHTSSAPMSAETLFHAHAELHVSPDHDARLLKAELERLSDELMVDIMLDETPATS